MNPTIKSSNGNDEVQTSNIHSTAEAKVKAKVITEAKARAITDTKAEAIKDTKAEAITDTKSEAITEAGENVQSSILQPILDLIPIKAMDNDDEDDDDNFHEDDDDDDDDEHENADVAETEDVGDILQEIDAEEAALANQSSPTRQDLNIGN